MDYKKKILESRNQFNVTYRGLSFQDLHRAVRLFNEGDEYLKFVWQNIDNFKPKKKR